MGKLLAVLLVCLSAAGLAIGLSRALIITTMALVGFHLAMRSRGRTRQLIIWVPLVLIPVGFYCYTTMQEWAPEGVERFEKAFDFSSQSRANAERAQQAEAMLAQWETSPIMGTGVGVALQSGYSRYSNGLLFELQYHALLYKTGLVGLTSLLGLIFICVKPVFWTRKGRPGAGQGTQAVVWLALANGVLAIAVCGAVNPYLTGAYFSLLAALQLAYDAALPALAGNSCERTEFEAYQPSGGYSSACRRRAS